MPAGAMRTAPGLCPSMSRPWIADLLREVTSERSGSVEQAVAAGLVLRYAGRSCFRSEGFMETVGC